MNVTEVSGSSYTSASISVRGKATQDMSPFLRFFKMGSESMFSQHFLYLPIESDSGWRHWQ